MNEVLSPIAAQGILGALLVIALGVIAYLHRKLLAEKDARNSDAQRSNAVLFPYLDTLKAIVGKLEQREAEDRRRAEIREIQEEAARDREDPPMRERIPTGKHRPYSSGGRRDGE